MAENVVDRPSDPPFVVRWIGKYDMEAFPSPAQISQPTGHGHSQHVGARLKSAKRDILSENYQGRLGLFNEKHMFRPTAYGFEAKVSRSREEIESPYSFPLFAKDSKDRFLNTVGRGTDTHTPR